MISKHEEAPTTLKSDEGFSSFGAMYRSLTMLGKWDNLASQAKYSRLSSFIGLLRRHKIALTFYIYN